MRTCAPAILPVDTSFLKNSVMFASLSWLKRAPAGISNVPSARADDSVTNISAPKPSARKNVNELMEPLSELAGSVAAASVDTRAAKRFQSLLMHVAAAPGKAAKYDAGQRGRRRQRFYRRGDRNFRGTFCWKSEHAGRDRGKRHGSEIVVTANLDRTAIAGGKLLIPPAIAAVP